MPVWFVPAALVVLLAACVAVALVAMRCGRSGGPWFCAALFFTPLVALLMLVALNTSTAPAAAPDAGRRSRRPVRSPEERPVGRDAPATPPS